MIKKVKPFDPNLGSGLCPVVSGHWTHQDADMCPILDMCLHRNVSSGTGHWTQAPPPIYAPYYVAKQEPFLGPSFG